MTVELGKPSTKPWAWALLAVVAITVLPALISLALLGVKLSRDSFEALRMSAAASLGIVLASAGVAWSRQQGDLRRQPKLGDSAQAVAIFSAFALVLAVLAGCDEWRKHSAAISAPAVVISALFGALIYGLIAQVHFDRWRRCVLFAPLALTAVVCAPVMVVVGVAYLVAKR